MQNGISPLIGENGRAVQASIAHLPPDQQHQQLTEGAQSGLYPFSLAIALQAALRLQPPAQSPPPGTVVGDMIQQLSGGQQAPMQQMPPQGMPPQPGLAGLPVSNIGTQAMAGGGIVAFAEGGRTPYMTDEEEARFNRLDALFGADAGRRRTLQEMDEVNKLQSLYGNEYNDFLSRRQQISDELDRQNEELQPIGEAALISQRYGLGAPPVAPVASVASVAGATGQDTVAGGATGDPILASSTAAPVIPPNNGFNNLFGISPAYEKMIRDAAPGPEINEAEIRAQSDRELVAAGIGNAANAYAKKVAGYTSEDIKNINREGKQAQAAAYFDAAASGDTTFLGSISRGLGGAARAKLGTSKELRTAQREAEKAQYDLDAAREALSLQKTDRGTAAVDKAEARRDQKLGVYQTLRSGQEQMNMSMQIALAKAAGKGSNVKTVEAVYAKRVEELEALRDRENDPARLAGIDAALGDVRGRLEQASAAADALDAKNQEALKGKLNDAVDKELAQPDSLMATAKRQIAILTNKSTSEELDSDDVAKLQQYQNMYNNQYNAVAQRIYSIYGQSGGGGGNSDYTGYSVVPSE